MDEQPYERGYMPEEHGYMEAMNLVATTFATQRTNFARTNKVIGALLNKRTKVFMLIKLILKLGSAN